MREFDEQLAWWQRRIRRALLWLLITARVPRHLVPTWLMLWLAIPSAADLRLLCSAFAELAEHARVADAALKALGQAFAGIPPLDVDEWGRS
jgi:hypothetical protein